VIHPLVDFRIHLDARLPHASKRSLGVPRRPTRIFTYFYVSLTCPFLVLKDAGVMVAIPEVQSHGQFFHRQFLCFHKAQLIYPSILAGKTFAPSHSYWLAPLLIKKLFQRLLFIWHQNPRVTSGIQGIAAQIKIGDRSSVSGEIHKLRRGCINIALLPFRLMGSKPFAQSTELGFGQGRGRDSITTINDDMTLKLSCVECWHVKTATNQESANRYNEDTGFHFYFWLVQRL
jgi:hypothetical protein